MRVRPIADAETVKIGGADKEGIMKTCAARGMRRWNALKLRISLG